MKGKISAILRAIFPLAVILSFPALVFADSVLLKSGQFVMGSIIERTDQYIRVESGGKLMQYYFRDIETINGESINLPKEKDKTVAEPPKNHPQGVRGTIPDLENFYNNSGIGYQGQTRGAVNILGYVRDNPDDSITYLRKAGSHIAQDNPDQAVSEYTKAIEVNPKLVEAYVKRGGIYEDKGDYSRAISDYTKAIEIEPGNVLALVYRGEAYQANGDFDKAIADFNKAVEIKPDSALAYKDLALIYFKEQEYEKSWENVNKVEALGWQVDPAFLVDLKKVSGREK